MFMKPEGEVLSFWEGLLDWRALARYWKHNKERWSWIGRTLASSGGNQNSSMEVPQSSSGGIDGSHLNAVGGDAERGIFECLKFLDHWWWGVEKTDVSGMDKKRSD